MSKLLFDEQFYLNINTARWKVANRVLETLKTRNHISIETCLDIGCGPGWFANRITQLGISVQGLDGRRELIEEAKRRCPAAQFTQLNIEDSMSISGLVSVDLVFCFGILYHVENPFMLLRNLHSLTKKILIIESMFVPSDFPCAWMVDEGKNETQGLSYQSIILSQPALVAILKRIGFACVYRYSGQLNHPDFIETENSYPRRAIFLASHSKLDLDYFEPCPRIALPKFDFANKIVLNKHQ